MRHIAQKTMLILLLPLMLGACASSSPSASRYVLPGGALSSAPSEPEGVVEVTTPRLPHYLDVEGIVMQTDDITLHEANGHQWAEALGRQLERGLRARLSAALPAWRVVRNAAGDDQAITLRLEVDQFQGRHDGLAIASGQWQLLDHQNNVLSMNTFQTDTPLAEDGYPALVRALGKSWDRVGEQIARALKDVQ
ncbi:ABC-type transport auxiliary lipoprotein family protein [Halomonas sp. CUBES01]|uniref:ABC-type transport auxiliary lipoprotein family protein n=1 Tax=Vreelandella gomseomensis TaxID=370766 RepID=A0ABU1GAD5_9GAMM|nr:MULTISPECIES: ABC-type transport auxiliary lipoprotein family protein [Halomonas]MDR5874450.1 ABC-type transport auxiliary lipoprotein family protein [Halomonas gomseomensis]MEC4767443.1 ABC-type transport auxiliary lipoprotein family protein [Halomonas sp. CUBES01]